MSEREYELKVKISGKLTTKIWDGENGLNACERYQDAHPDHVVIAWRDISHGVFVLGNARQIIG